MNLTSFQRPELRDANNNVTQSGTYSVKNGVLTNAQNSGVLDYINNNLQAHQNAIETLQTGALQTKIVTSLPNPSVADANTIYMIKYTSGSDEYYYQYRFIDGSFVRVGDTKIDITDLTNKVTTNTTNIATLSSGKANLSGATFTGNVDLGTLTGSVLPSHFYHHLYGGDATGTVVYEHCYPSGFDLTRKTSLNIRLSNGNGGFNSVVFDSNGLVYASTPATTDSSDKLATTAYVKAQKTLISTSTSITTTTTLAYTGVSVTIPANSYFAFRAQCEWARSAPQEILISDSSTAYAIYQTIARSYNASYCSYCGCTDSSARTFYIWARYSAENSNPIKVRGWYEAK